MSHDREHHDGCAEQGLYAKYEIHRTDGADQPGGRHHGCRYFVLDLTHDPAARDAARSFAWSIATERPRLSTELRELLRQLSAEALP